MKKFIILAIISIIIILGTTSCTENVIARQFGGTVTVKVKPGYKVTSATWKDADLFYFLEPMEEDYIPKTKEFVESSNYGVLESTVVFIETKN